MLKTLYRQIGQYKWAAVMTPVLTALEVVMDVLIPWVTASLIDKGINAGNMENVYRYGGLMLLMAFVSLALGILAGRSSAVASTGFAANLRSAMYRNIQRFAFSDIDKYSTAGLVTRMTTDVQNLQQAFQQILRVTEVINEEPDIVNPENPVMEVADGSLEFQGVRFDYKAPLSSPEGDTIVSKSSEAPSGAVGGASGSRRSALYNVTFSVGAGETIGVIGGTGSGKSTLVSLVSRLYDATKGSVLVGGRNVKDYDLKTLRSAVAVVLQQNTLFTGSILDNLRWGRSDATLEECREACRMAQADEFIMEMPNGYDTHIEQGGTNVSGGQKQRLCIARALLRHPKILILDDSTSACDTDTDRKIQQAFRTQLPEMTKLIIAQRISSVQHCDRILVMEGGHVTGYDTHEHLLETNQFYREVNELQSLGTGDFDKV